MKLSFLPALLATLLTASSASAQMMLPGALQAAPEGPATPNPGGAGQARPKPVVAKPPGEETIIDRDLLRDGSQGLIAFQRAAGKGLEIKALSMAGEQITHPGEACRIDVIAGDPIEARPLGKPKGLLRYGVDIEACPFSFDVYEGAVLIAHEGKACDFVAADCRVDPSGFWGPAGSSFDDKQVKQFESARGRAEASMRAQFHALVASLGKDKDAVKKIASEQAGFSSEREVACRNYAREDVHGFCALRLTQGRGFALQAALEAGGKERGQTKKAKGARNAKAEARP
ncbi:conserved exported hypothetical protein [Methylocella tundrae]|uniref:Lysozyme inhibitor LprI N-terminal domain-containing protein n=1 Tax=Methylocella tundrae TaxID=227605 RepID=A0A8B6M087_METTU|nr:hypothetical protein [Methylocella tundrae]VTZ48451.1 conserved exported hypothetical protein [Methylocella tundrae]